MWNLGFANRKSLAQHFTRFHGIVDQQVCLEAGDSEVIDVQPNMQALHYLKNHLARHMAKPGQEEAKNYPCDTCNQNFASKAVLGTHIKRVHQTLVRAFPCPVCGVKPAKKKWVAQHMSPVHM